jgi:hypothetical protein
MFSDGSHKPSVSICSGVVICLVWIGIAGVGCRTDGLDVNLGGIRAFNSGKKSVDSIRLFTSSALFNIDGEPGSNGFSARLFAVHNGIAKPIQITEGTLEIIIYDGDASRDQSLKPRQVWSFSGTDLPRYLRQTSIGFSYDFTLKIDNSKPLPGKVSIGAKYTLPEGDSIFAKTVSIAIEP